MFGSASMRVIQEGQEKNIRALWMVDDRVMFIDQKILPHRFEFVDASTVEELAVFIEDMTVRGAPSIGGAGAYGMALAQIISNHEFKLYKTLKKAKKIKYDRELFFWVYFTDSIRGLSIGAPVEFRGVKIGEVVNFSLEGDASTAQFRIPILIKVEPQRFTVLNDKHHLKGNTVDVDIFKNLLKKGFRAQLKSGNLLTGELFVDLNMHEDVSPGELKMENGFYVIPTVPATIETLKSDVKTVLDKIAAIPFESIGNEMNGLMSDVRNKTLPDVNSAMQNLNILLKDTNKMMNAANRNYFDANAEVNKKLIKLLDELTRTSRSIKHLTDYLERHPESLIKGK